jgi:hypothetical protein
MYKYNGGLYVYVQQLTGSTFTARKLFKKIGTSWTQIPLTISTPSGLSGYHLFYSHNSYVGLSYYNNSTSQYVTYIGKFLDENTISSFSLISESEGANYYIFSDTLDNIEFDGILMQTRSAYPNKSIISVKLQGSTYIKNSISFPEFPETYTPYSRNIASCFYNNTDLQLLRNFYGITNSNELLIFNSFDSSKKLLAFKLTINLDGSMNKQLIETHSYTYNVAFSLSTHRGYIEADGSFSSFSGRLFVVPSKVQLPTLTALASNLKYYIKVN